MNRPLWSWPELCRAVGAPSVDGPDVHGLDIDSRRIGAGDLFVALTGDPGARFNVSSRSDRDGHDYVQNAIDAGGVGAMVHRKVPVDAPLLEVEDTLDGLWALGRAGRRRLTCPVVAVTGSSGKTTVKGFVAEAFGAFSTSGSLNNHLGVPLSLARAPVDAAAAVFEIGTNHPGEIAPLAKLTEPDVAVVLNVQPAHIENFADLDAIRLEKLSIAEGLDDTGTLVVHDLVDVPEGTAAHVIRFGESDGADVRLVTVRGRVARIVARDQSADITVPGGGHHRALSLCATAAVAVALSQPIRSLAALSEDTVPKGRGNRVEVGSITIIDDSYNANPASMGAALLALGGESGGGRKLAFLGDMLELGDDAAQFHRELAADCEQVDGVFCVGPMMRQLYDALPVNKRLGFAETVGELDDEFAFEPNDTVLIKGSNRVFWASRYVDRLIETLSRR